MILLLQTAANCCKPFCRKADLLLQNLQSYIVRLQLQHRTWQMFEFANYELAVE